jgi:adenylate kinase
MAEGVKAGELGFLLDGFPRTRAQALALMDLADVQLALNLTLRESVSYPACFDAHSLNNGGHLEDALYP